jgi:hypothetical protein
VNFIHQTQIQDAADSTSKRATRFHSKTEPSYKFRMEWRMVKIAHFHDQAFHARRDAPLYKGQAAQNPSVYNTVGRTGSASPLPFFLPEIVL